jgi:hypothetical protein
MKRGMSPTEDELMPTLEKEEGFKTEDVGNAT